MQLVSFSFSHHTFLARFCLSEDNVDQNQLESWKMFATYDFAVRTVSGDDLKHWGSLDD